MDITLYPGRDLLAEFYADESAEYPIFREVSIAGYPVAIRQRFVGSGNCNLAVGLGLGQSLEVSYGDRTTPRSDVCGAATAAIEAVLMNLPPG